MKCEKVTLPILCSFVLLLHPLCSRLLALIISDLRAQNEDCDGQSDFKKISSPSCSKTFNNFCLVLFSNLAHGNILYIFCIFYIFSAEIFLVVENYKIHSKSRLITRKFSSAWKLDSREEFSLVVHPLLKLGRKNLGGKLNPTEQHKSRKRTHIW